MYGVSNMHIAPSLLNAEEGSVLLEVRKTGAGFPCTNETLFCVMVRPRYEACLKDYSLLNRYSNNQAYAYIFLFSRKKSLIKLL
jgi:hypothetical protein